MRRPYLPIKSSNNSNSSRFGTWSWTLSRRLTYRAAARVRSCVPSGVGSFGVVRAAMRMKASSSASSARRLISALSSSVFESYSSSSLCTDGLHPPGHFWWRGCFHWCIAGGLLRFQGRHE